MIRLKLFMSVLFFIVIVYYSYKFVQLMIKMKRAIILPRTQEEMAVIRKYPKKTVDFPMYSTQKTGIIVYFLMLLYLLAMFSIGAVNKNIDWSFYLLLFLPLLYSNNLLNVFAVVDDGLLSGSRFIAWNKIKSFHFVPIDTNHKFYGYSKEINGGYELKMKTRFFSTSCVVTSTEMKDRLAKILKEQVTVKEEKST